MLAHAVDGIGELGSEDGVESVSMQADRQGGHAFVARRGDDGVERRVARLAHDHGVADRAERRVAVSEPAALIGQIAAEEAADLIVVGSHARGRLRRGLESKLARQLETATPVPVLIAPPRDASRSKAAS